MTDNVKVTLTDAQLATINSALASIIGIVGSASFTTEGTPVALPPAAECNLKEQEAALVRCVVALRNKAADAERQVLVAAKKGVDDKMHMARLARVEAYREIAALSPAVKAMLGDKAAPPTSTNLPVSEVVGFFPSNLTEPQIIALLHKMNYKLVAGAKKDDVKKLIVHIGSEFLAKTLASAPKTETEETTETVEG